MEGTSFNKPTFGFNLQASGKRSVNPNPEFTVSCTKGAIKLNEKAARILDIKAGEYLALVNDELAVNAAIEANDPAILEWAEANDKPASEFPITWAIFKGFAKYTTDGEPMMTTERLTKAKKARLIEEGQVDEEGNVIAPEVQAYEGCKMASVNNEAGFANISGSDSANWVKLGGSEDFNIAYDVSKEGIDATVAGQGVVVFPLLNPRQVEKIERGGSEEEAE